MSCDQIVFTNGPIQALISFNERAQLLTRRSEAVFPQVCCVLRNHLDLPPAICLLLVVNAKEVERRRRGGYF